MNPLIVGLFVALGASLAGVLAAVVFVHRPHVARMTGYGLAGVGGVGSLTSAVSALAHPSPAPLAVYRIISAVPVVVGLDPLAAWFVMVLSVVGVAVALAALGYARAYDDHGGPRLAAAFNIFQLTMLLVLVLDSVFAFLVAWEAMSLASYVLVVHEHERRAVRRAGFVYLAMTHVGTAFLTISFLILASAGHGLDFAALRAGAAQLGSEMRAIVFLGALIGFGAKAGLVPLHVWLPRAHPVAPSHVSALMSGVMLKIAIYGFVRVTFDFLGAGPTWWGYLVLGIGLVSAVLGALYTVLQSELKTLLAYCSVENVGIITIGVGASLLLRSGDHPTLAALALVAALFHVLNHALFKALLFLGAGAIDQATGTKDLERLGGLIHRMPQTSMLFGIGAAAISALPPFNGFASEWLVFQALLGVGTATPELLSGLIGLVAAALLALTGAVAAAAFVKAFGVAFLALPRSDQAARVAEAPFALRLGMMPLAVACVGLGLAPAVALGPLDVVATQLLGIAVPVGPVAGLAAPGNAHLIPLGTFGAMVVLAAVPFLALRWFGSVPERRAPAWVCGWRLVPSMTYGATAFAQPIRLFFRAIIRPETQVERGYALEPYFVDRVRYRGWIPHHFEQRLYGPLTGRILRLAHVLRRIQNGSLRLYLAYVLATLIVLLILTR